MSDSEDSSQFDFDDDDSGSDDFTMDKKKVNKKAPAKKVLSAPSKSKPPAGAKKPAPKVKSTISTTAPTKKKGKILEERDTNGDSDDDGAEEDEEDEDGDILMDLPAGPSKPNPKPTGKPKTASETYTRLSQIEHILVRPDSYIGSVEPISQPMWVFDIDLGKLVYRQTTFVPGFYKIFDEILVNAADNKVRDSSMSFLKVVIDIEKNMISVMNDGAGIPIEMHDQEKMMIPELIFGQLLTSSNYDDGEEKTTGGRNGYGAKLTNIYSNKFILETAHSKSKKTYKQTWTKNMQAISTPIINENTKDADWTKVTFYPDLNRFNMKDLDKDTVALLYKRVYDLAGITKDVKVSLNGNLIKMKGGFKGYVDMYLNGVNEVSGSKASSSTSNGELVGADPLAANGKQTIIYEKFGERWEIAFAVSDGQFNQISYCNSIATYKGGKHVDYITDQIINGVADLVKKKNKAAPVKPFQIKNHLSIFVNCLIANPRFDSQTKENMTLGVKQFGSTCKLTEEFLKKVAKSGVVDNVLSWAKFKQDQALKKTDGHKRSRITGLVKLEDANNAGTKNGSKCTLILTEGDSAKALAVSGLSVVGRDNFGVFPLRGKLLNVREASGKTLTENVEIQAIKQILGLQQGKVYTSTESLRYGSLMIMADQDHDGSHIKGLIINFLDYWFPSLLKLPNFLLEFITPIVKATKGKKEVAFFTIPEYETWKEENDGPGWKYKYFKGLGTSTAVDAKKYFGDMRQHRLPFKVSNDDDRDLIDMAFNKKKADNRKEWLRGFVPGTFMNHNVTEVPIADFVNKELILFSMADNVRSIPSVVDGFKPGQRKVLYSCFLKNLTPKQELKVGQLAGYVSEKSAYHHGEASLNGTIIGLAQDFVGSNNINVLLPNGQFGTRLQGGKDAASARYVFTTLAPVTRTLFQPADDKVLDYLNDDGYDIEPSWYIPILPMVLVNGSDGIGTGWSSSIPNYNPADLVANLKRKMADEELAPMHPWYRGFRGTIEKTEKDGYKINGLIEQVDDSTIEITELPIRMWTQTYKEQLESWVTGTEKTPALVKDYKEYHTDSTVHFVITLTEKGKESVKKEGLEKTFKTTAKISTSNMVCFDPQGKIKKYATPEDVLSDFYDIRLEYYHKRKAFLLNELTNIHDKLSNQARFIQMIISKQLVISNRKKADIVKELRSKDFRPFPRASKGGSTTTAAPADEDEDEESEEGQGQDSDYDYLLGMALFSLTKEKVDKLLAERDGKEVELMALSKLTAQDLWVRDLDTFSTQWEELLEADIVAKNRSLRAAKGKGKGKAAKKAKMYSDSEDDDVSDGEFQYKPVKRAPVGQPKAKPKPVVPLPSDDEDVVMADDDKPSPVAAAPKPIIAPKPKPAPKKREAIDLSDLSDEEYGKAGPSKPAKKAEKEKEKAPVAKKVKKAIVISDDEEQDDKDPFALPARPPPAPKSPSQKEKEKKVAPKAAPKAAPKKASKKDKDDSSDTDYDAIVVPKKKAAPSKKKALASDDEDEDDVIVPVKAPTARRAAAAKKSYKMALDSDDEEEEEDDASDFEEDD